MPIIKVIKKSGKTLNSLKAVLEYVGKKAENSFGINCSSNYKQVFNDFRETKKFFQKENGRQYRHYIQSFAPGEIQKEKLLKVGIEWAEKSFKDYEILIVTHTDKKHLHNHIIVNTVNYITGKKLQENKKDLAEKKKLNNEICLENGINNTIKSKEIGEITSFNREKYEIIKKGADITKLAQTILEVSTTAVSKEDFILKTKEKGYYIDWKEEKKHITFTVDKNILEGKKDKFRLSNLNKTFNIPLFTKENLMEKFEENSLKKSFSILDKLNLETENNLLNEEFYLLNTNSLER